MKNFLYLLRHIFLVIFAFLFILLFPLSRTYRVTHSKMFSEKFWVGLISEVDFTRILATQIPEKEFEEIKKDPNYQDYKEKIDDYFSEYIIERKFRPFMKKIVDYLLKKRDSLPKPVSLVRERRKLYFYLSQLFSAKISKVPYKFRNQAQLILQRKVFKFFPKALVAERIIVPRILQKKKEIRNRLADYNSHAKWALIIPVLFVALIALLAFSPRKILGWLGASLIIAFPLFIAYNLIIFYGLSPAEYIYEKLSLVPDLRTFINPNVISLKELKQIFRDMFLKPLAIEAVIYLIIGIAFVLTAFILKKKENSKAQDDVEVVE